MTNKDDSILKQDACYHLTLGIIDWTDIFIRPVFKQVIIESLNYFVSKRGLVLYGWCLMTNHLHLLAQPEKSFNLSLLIKDFKKFTTRIILDDIDAEPEARRTWILKNFREAAKSSRQMERFQVWQEKINPIEIDMENLGLLHEQLDLIHNTPVRERVVSKAEEYLHSSARDYFGMNGLVNIRLADEKKDPGFILRHIPAYRYRYIPITK